MLKPWSQLCKSPGNYSAYHTLEDFCVWCKVQITVGLFFAHGHWIFPVLDIALFLSRFKCLLVCVELSCSCLYSSLSRLLYSKEPWAKLGQMLTSVLVSFLLQWFNTLTNSNLGRKGSALLTSPGSSPSQEGNKWRKQEHQTAHQFTCTQDLREGNEHVLGAQLALSTLAVQSPKLGNSFVLFQAGSSCIN